MASGLKPPAGRRVAVVGAGPGGLAAAMLLARAGLSVTLLERADAVGGRTRGFTTPEGFTFDFGPTFFLYPRVLEDIFAACGERLSDHVELKRLDPLYNLVFEGAGELRASSDVARLKAEVARFSPRDAQNVERFLQDNRNKLAAFRPVLEQSFCRPADYASPAMLAALPHLRPRFSVDRDLRRFFSDARVRLAFSFQTKYLGMSPFQCPSLFTILSFLEYEHGVFHPIGGCGAISEAMARVAAKLGVDIRLGETVERVVYRDGAPVAVETSGGLLPADAVVINGDFGHAARRLVPESARPRWPDAKIDKARLSCSTFMLYLGLEGDTSALEHHTILLARDHERNVREIMNGTLSDEPSIYIQNACRTDPGLAPPGHSALYVLAPVPNLRSGVDWSEAAGRFRETVLKRLALTGLPDIEKRIRFERMITPPDWRDEFAINEAATFNLSHDLGQMLNFRPGNRFGDTEALYLVGGGTHPGSGLPGIYEGARISSNLLLRDLGLEGIETRLPGLRQHGMEGAVA